jgi:hypothetical protein
MVLIACADIGLAGLRCVLSLVDVSTHTIEPVDAPEVTGDVCIAGFPSRFIARNNADGKATAVVSNTLHGDATEEATCLGKIAAEEAAKVPGEHIVLVAGTRFGTSAKVPAKTHGFVLKNADDVAMASGEWGTLSLSGDKLPALRLFAPLYAQQKNAPFAIVIVSSFKVQQSHHDYFFFHGIVVLLIFHAFFFFFFFDLNSKVEKFVWLGFEIAFKYDVFSFCSPPFPCIV